MPRGVKVNDDVIESPNNQMHTLSIEKMAAMYMSLQERTCRSCMPLSDISMHNA